MFRRVHNSVLSHAGSSFLLLLVALSYSSVFSGLSANGKEQNRDVSEYRLRFRNETDGSMICVRIAKIRPAQKALSFP